MHRRLMSGFAAVAVGAAVALIPHGASAGTYPGRDGRLLFMRSNQIYTITSGGTGMTKLTTSGKNYGAKWSPDGKRIAFVHEAPAGVRNVWVMNADGSSKKQVTTAGLVKGSVTWSPDGKWIAFANMEYPGDDYYGDLSKVKSTAPYGAPQLIKAKADVGDSLESWRGRDPSWSPNGRYIAFDSDQYPDSPDEYFLVLDTKTGLLDEIDMVGGSCCGEGYFDNPNWSPDSKKLAWEEEFYDEDQSGGTPSIAVMKYPGGGGGGFSSANNDTQPAFSPSGKYVALENSSRGTANIFITNASGGGRRLLTSGYGPDWQPLR